MLDHFRDTQKLQEILRQAQTGLWVIELDDGQEPRMYADSSMLGLLGFESEPAPEQCYQEWYDRIEDDYYPIIESGVEKMIKDEQAEVQYPWEHPKWGRIYVRCGGVRDWNYKQGVRLRGYHQNITNTVMLKQEYDAVIQSLSDSYTGIFLCNVQDRTYKTIKTSDSFRLFTQMFSDYEEFFCCYAANEASYRYEKTISNIVKSHYIKERILEGETQIEEFYRSRTGDWKRIKIVPSAGYSEEFPWVIVAFDEQDKEMEARINARTAQVAVSQIYQLVISADLRKSEYSCIHGSEDLICLESHGTFGDFQSRMKQKMPLEDRELLDQIFDKQSYRKKSYLEGVLRVADDGGNLHYYDYYSACIQQNREEHILLTLRCIDDKRESQLRENVLSNLCECYYSIYLFDLENDIEEAIWQEADIYRRREFPKGSLSLYYEKFICEHVYEEDQEKMRRAGNPDFLRRTLSADQPVYDVDFRRVYPDRISWVRSRFSIGEMRDGTVTKVVFANMNINEQKMVEMEEEKQKKLYFESRNIIKGLSSFYHSVFYVDLTEGTFQSFRIRKDLEDYLKGSDSYHMLKSAYMALIHEKEKEKFARELSIESIQKRVGAGETIYAQEFRRNYDGCYGWMRMHVILAESRNGVPVKVILAAHSVEEEKEQEERNKKALLAAYEAAKNANEAKSSFLAQMSHDIRTPMNAIIGMSSIAASRIGEPEKVKDCLEKIDMSSRHLLDLIDEILDMSKIEKGKIELTEGPFCMRELITDINSITRPEALKKEHELLFKTKDLVHVNLEGDAGRLRQVLINLITNAVKYTSEGGRITVTVQEVSGRFPGHASFVFTVEDNGIGMDEEFLSYIFVPFSRADDSKARNVQGTGLGMSIAHGIVSAMNGNIQVESKKGEGSRFIVTLNLKIADPDQVVEHRMSGLDSYGDTQEGVRTLEKLKGKQLLLVEDNELNMEIAETILTEAGFLVDKAENGRQALEMFTDSEPGYYHAVLMDLQMPVMDGYTASKEIRRSSHPQSGTIPIIALTANAFAEDMAKALAAGMNDHVSKPIDYGLLIKVLEKNMKL
ncbi:hybrid sensor histidine kinase/response regulator [Anaerostipes sp.]|uniref:hybrid sensor histidine kinase/response regulator n=1 Tax=Anaerostipes sp. TaxID=1872530 RepID=UPI0025C4EF51|nr:ATP-binding protein [Anaerostipes sp.]MBS7009701.1 response regulator [Anaerostipes sp.]